jgi:hypothetical protein
VVSRWIQSQPVVSQSDFPHRLRLAFDGLGIFFGSAQESDGPLIVLGFREKQFLFLRLAEDRPGAPGANVDRVSRRTCPLRDQLGSNPDSVLTKRASGLTGIEHSPLAGRTSAPGGARLRSPRTRFPERTGADQRSWN